MVFFFGSNSSSVRRRFCFSAIRKTTYCTLQLVSAPARTVGNSTVCYFYGTLQVFTQHLWSLLTSHSLEALHKTRSLHCSNCIVQCFYYIGQILSSTQIDGRTKQLKQMSPLSTLYPTPHHSPPPTHIHSLSLASTDRCLAHRLPSTQTLHPLVTPSTCSQSGHGFARGVTQTRRGRARQSFRERFVPDACIHKLLDVHPIWATGEFAERLWDWWVMRWCRSRWAK